MHYVALHGDKNFLIYMHNTERQFKRAAYKRMQSDAAKPRR